jgi:uncharacterized protein
MRKSLSRILAAASPAGDVEAVRKMAQQARDGAVDAIALLGNLTAKGADPREYGNILNAVGETRLPTFYIPGPDDAPLSEFLREAASFEVAFPNVRGVHSTFALAPTYTLWSGWGGVIDDDPNWVRDETASLCYPGREIVYRLKFLQDLKEYQKVFLFTTLPEHKGLGQKGSLMLAELIKTYNPRLVLVGGEQRQVTIGKSLVVMLGSLANGDFTLIDLRKNEVTPGTLQRSAKAA